MLPISFRCVLAGGKIEPFADATEPVSLSGANAPTFAPPPEASFCPIRFPGQWEDAESGLYYNRLRYYGR